MRIFLDDKRQEPEDWVRCYWPNEVIALLEKHGPEVTHLSLDHDLGDDDRGTGYTVMLWLEEQVLLGKLKYIPIITFHTDNPVGREKMASSLAVIQSFINLGERV